MIISKDLLGRITTPLAFLAQVKAEETAAFAEISATSFTDEKMGVHIIANDMPNAFSPLTGQKMAAVKVNTKAEFASSDFEEEGDFVEVAHCECSAHLFTTVEAAEVIEGQEFHCVACGTKNVAKRVTNDEDAKGETADVVAKEGDADTVTPVDPTVKEAAGAEEADADAAAAGDADTNAEVTDTPAADADVTIAGKDDEDEDDAEFDDVDVDEEDDEEDDGDDEVEEIDPDDEDEEDDDADTEEASVAVATLDVNFTDHMDILPQTVQVSKLEEGNYAGFAYELESGAVRLFGYFNPAKAAEEARALFKGDLKTLNRALTAALESEASLDSFGFIPLTASVPVDQEVNDRIEAAQAEHAAAAQSTAEDQMDIFEQSLGIAVAGMNKGYFENPMVNALASELSRYGIDNAEALAIKTVSAAMPDYMRSAVTKAKELATKSEETRETLASNIEEAKSALTVTKTSAPSVSTATLIVPPLSTEHAGAEKPAQKPRKKLFSGVGYANPTLVDRVTRRS